MPSTTASTDLLPLSRPQCVEATSVEWWEPAGGDRGPAVVLGHGAGSNRTNPVLRRAAERVAAEGCPAALFNFAYAEAARRRPDPAARLEAAFRDVLAAARARFGVRGVVLGGRSMGGRIATHLAAQGDGCAALVLLGYPLHAAGRPDRLRTEHWPLIRCPVLFVQGDRDALCPLDTLERERTARLTGATSTVHVLAGGDHGFRLRKQDGADERDVHGEVAEVVAGWIRGLPE